MRRSPFWGSTVSKSLETPRHRPDFSHSESDTYYQVMFASPDGSSSSMFRSVRSKGNGWRARSLYVHPTCTSCRNAQAWLDERGVAYERRDYFHDRFTKDESPLCLLRRGSRRAMCFRRVPGPTRSWWAIAISRTQLLDLMIQEPTLLRRPLVVAGDVAVVGFDRKGLERVAGA